MQVYDDGDRAIAPHGVGVGGMGGIGDGVVVDSRANRDMACSRKVG